MPYIGTTKELTPVKRMLLGSRIFPFFHLADTMCSYGVDIAIEKS